MNNIISFPDKYLKDSSLPEFPMYTLVEILFLFNNSNINSTSRCVLSSLLHLYPLIESSKNVREIKFSEESY